MSNKQVRERERSSSPDNYIKLHVSKLPVGFPQSHLQLIFSQFGPLGEIRVIRKGPKGFPFKNACYAFIEMKYRSDANRALEFLRQQGWSVTISAHSQPITQPLLDKRTDWSGTLICPHTKEQITVQAQVVTGSFNFQGSCFTLTQMHLPIMACQDALAVLSFESLGTNLGEWVKKCQICEKGCGFKNENQTVSLRQEGSSLVGFVMQTRISRHMLRLKELLESGISV